MDYEEDPFVSDPSFAPLVTVLSVTFLVGFLGNSLVVFAMLGDRKSRSVTTTFLVSLAIADLLFLLWCAPYEIGHRFTEYWSGGKALCLTTAFVKTLGGVASVLNLVAVSVERFIVIVLPLKSRQLCTTGTSKKIICAVWVASILLALPVLHFHDEFKFSYEDDNGTMIVEVHCGRKNDINTYFAIYQLFIIFIIPSIIMTVCYSMVIRVLWLSTKQLSKMTASTTRKTQNGLKSSSPSSEMRKPLTSSCTCKGLTRVSPSVAAPLMNKPVKPTTKRCCSCLEARDEVNAGCAPPAKDHTLDMREARKQVIKMLITIVLVFLICWGPPVIFEVIHTFKAGDNDFDNSAIFVYVKLAMNTLPFFQSCLNPIIYTFMSSNFRRNIRTLCMKCALRLRCCRKNMPDYEMECKSGLTMSSHVRMGTRVSGPQTSSSN